MSSIADKGFLEGGLMWLLGQAYELSSEGVAHG